MYGCTYGWTVIDVWVSHGMGQVDVLGCQCGSAHIRHVWVRRMAGYHRCMGVVWLDIIDAMGVCYGWIS